MKLCFENIINSDQTLKSVLRVYRFDYDKLDTQIEIYKSCFLIALSRYLNQKYK